MDKEAMVTIDVAKGSEILDALEQANLKVNVALWAFMPEYEEWRLILAARRLDNPDVRESYGLLHDALSVAGFTPRPPPLFSFSR